MLTSKDIAQRKVEIEQLANKYGIQSVRIYGSVARGCADEDSDVDLLVEAKDGWSQNLDFLYNLNHIIITYRLTNHMAQFG